MATCDKCRKDKPVVRAYDLWLCPRCRKAIKAGIEKMAKERRNGFPR